MPHGGAQARQQREARRQELDGQAAAAQLRRQQGQKRLHDTTAGNETGFQMGSLLRTVHWSVWNLIAKSAQQAAIACELGVVVARSSGCCAQRAHKTAAQHIWTTACGPWCLAPEFTVQSTPAPCSTFSTERETASAQAFRMHLAFRAAHQVLRHVSDRRVRLQRGAGDALQGGRR